MSMRGVIRPTTNISRRVLDFLEWVNTRYRCMLCDQSPEHEPGCEFYRLLCELRSKMQ
jgi:hypothetical protein